MSSKNVTTDVVSVDEQAFEQADNPAVDEDGFPVVDETPAFEAAVEQETQAKVDANHPDGIADTSEERIHGVTLEQEERGVTTGVHPAGFAAACLYKAGEEQGQWVTQSDVAETGNVTPTTVRTHHETIEEQVA